MKELFTCASCGDCAARPGFGFTFLDTYACAQRGDEVEPDDGCTLECAGAPVQAIEACEADVSGRVGYGTEVLERWPHRERSARRSGAPRTTRGPTATATPSAG